MNCFVFAFCIKTFKINYNIACTKPYLIFFIEKTEKKLFLAHIWRRLVLTEWLFNPIQQQVFICWRLIITGVFLLFVFSRWEDGATCLWPTALGKEGITIFSRFFEIVGETWRWWGSETGCFLPAPWQETILLGPGLAHSTRTRIIPGESAGNSSLS